MNNFAIHVGLDDTDFGNNAICYKQLESVAEGATVKKKAVTTSYMVSGSVSINQPLRDIKKISSFSKYVFMGMSIMAWSFAF